MACCHACYREVISNAGEKLLSMRLATARLSASSHSLHCGAEDAAYHSVNNRAWRVGELHGITAKRKSRRRKHQSEAAVSGVDIYRFLLARARCRRASPGESCATHRKYARTQRKGAAPLCMAEGRHSAARPGIAGVGINGGRTSAPQRSLYQKERADARGASCRRLCCLPLCGAACLREGSVKTRVIETPPLLRRRCVRVRKTAAPAYHLRGALAHK